jgi:hypothetical protein
MMKAHLTRFALTLAAAAVLIFAAAAPAAADTQSFRSQTPFGVVVPCANAGSGELVEGILKEHDVIGVTTDDAGGIHFQVKTDLQGVGIGDVTGDTYQMHADIPVIFFDRLNAGAGGSFNQSIDVSIGVIGMGGAPNFHLDERMQVTIDANGVVTMEKFFASVTCD